jgi:predicted enzyme related to lactoylglutathione lyase
MVMTSRAGALVHLELHTASLAGARSFCAQLCGWREEEVRRGERSYLALDLAPGLGGGIVQCPVGRPLWLPYVEVEHAGQATERALALGAELLLAPREGPAGWRSVIASPAAGELGLWQPKR